MLNISAGLVNTKNYVRQLGLNGLVIWYTNQFSGRKSTGNGSFYPEELVSYHTMKQRMKKEVSRHLGFTQIYVYRTAWFKIPSRSSRVFGSLRTKLIDFLKTHILNAVTLSIFPPAPFVMIRMDSKEINMWNRRKQCLRTLALLRTVRRWTALRLEYESMC